MDNAAVTQEREADGDVVRLAGRLVMAGLGPAERVLASVRAGPGPVTLDLSGVEALDTGGAWLVLDLARRLEAEGAEVVLRPAGDAQRDLLETVRRSLPAAEGVEEPPAGFVPWLAQVGRATMGMVEACTGLLGFLGLTVARIARTVVRPLRLRIASLVHHMQEAGLEAVPIICLMGFLIGIVLAFQGAVQLRQFGAEVFVVDLIAISILRELGVLLTAIIVAGRSGSAFTASIGSMKVREEVDAMRTLGLDPMEVLVVPRVLALLLMLPALAFLANMSGLIGGALMSWATLDVSPGMFITRLRDNTDVWHLGVGMIKAPVFAVIVAVVACYQGFQVGGSAESVGQKTTTAVVQAIFLVIVADAVFSVFFSEIGV